MYSICLANIPSHVTNCGNGWFSKLQNPDVNARDICESYGYTGIDMYGVNDGTLCSNSTIISSSNCGWDDGNNCGTTVDWHCVCKFLFFHVQCKMNSNITW